MPKSSKPCNFITETKEGKEVVMNYDQMRQFLLDNPEMWKGIEGLRTKAKGAKRGAPKEEVKTETKTFEQRVAETAKALEGKDIGDLGEKIGIEKSEKISESEDFETATKAILGKPNYGITGMMMGKETEVSSQENVHSHTYPKTGKTLNWKLSVFENNKGQKRYVLYEEKYPEQIDAAALVDRDGKVVQITTDKDFRKIGLAQTLLNKIKEDVGQIKPSEPISKAGKRALDNFTKQQVAEAYHKAKKDGTNPELVKAVEELIGEKEKPTAKPYVPEVIPAITKQQEAGEAELNALKKGDKITTNNPIRLLKGLYGKRLPDGTPFSVHKDVKGVFSSTSEKIARRYEGDMGIVVYELPAGVTVDTVQVVNTPESKGVAGSVVRQMETDAINDSDAQVVKLITTDAKGSEVQYIIKDPALQKAGYRPSERAEVDPVIKFLDSLKPDPGIIGMNAGLWKGFINIVKAAYIVSKSAAKAIQAGIDWLIAKKEDPSEWEKYIAPVRAKMQEIESASKKAVKSAVGKATGIKRSTKSEVQRIIDRAFAIGVGEGTQKGFQKGATAGMKAGAIEGRTQAVDMLRNALANLSGELTPKQISAIVERMGRLKTFSEAAKQSFIDYADKVIDDANYAAKEKKATEIKNAVKKISTRSNVAANDQSLYKSFAALSISHLSPTDLDAYMAWGEKIKNRALKPGDRAELSSFIERAQERQNAIVRERSEKMKEGRMRNLRAEFDEMEAAGTLPQGISTFEEYVDSKKPKPRGETLEDKISAINERLNEIPEGENEMIDKLRNADLSVLNKEDLTLIDNSLYNYIDTGKLYGIGDPLTKAEYLGNVKAAVEAGLKTRRQVDRKDVEKLGMSNLFTTIGETKDVAAKLRGLLIQPWLSAATKANSKYIEIEAALMAKADKLKIKQPNWNRIDLFGFLNEGEGNPELFEKLKEQKLSDLETLKEKVEANERDKDNSGTAEAQKYAYDSLGEAIQRLGLNEGSTLESIREKLSENELAFYNETRKYLDQYSPKAIENMELYGNKEVGITKNYWPRTTNRINEKTAGIDVFDLYGSEYVGKNMFGREKGRSRLLGKAGYYTPVGQENYFNGLKETMLIAEAAHEYHGMQALYNTPDKGFSQLIKGAGANDLKQLMIDWIMDTKNVGRYQGGVAKVGDDILNAIQKGFTRAMINNPTQIFKQPTALGYTFVEAPKPFFKAVGLIAQAMMQGKDSPLSKAINGLFETTTLGQRLYHPEIIEVKEKYAIDKPKILTYIQQLLKRFNVSIGGEFMVPTDAIVSQIATLAGYIEQAEKSGKPFNIFNEAERGYDMAASAAADQMQAKTNNENAAIYFSRKQLNNRALYYLSNFQANAVRNLYISIRKIVSGRTKQEVKEGLQGVAGYIFSTSLFVGAGMFTSYFATVEAFELYQKIMNALGDDEDDEKEKERILKYLNSRQLLNLKRKVAGEAISVATGVYGVMARAALEATLAGLEQAYYKSTPEEEAPTDRIFFTPEATGYAGVVADNIISPLEMTAKASDPQVEAMTQTGLLGAKILGQSAIAFYTQNLLNAKKLAEKEAKARKEEQTKSLEQRAFPKKKKLAEAKKEWTKSVEQGDANKAREAFNSIVKLSEDPPYITAIELRESFYKDKIKPSIISDEDEYMWIEYLFNDKFGDEMIGNEKLKNLVPPSEKARYIEDYKKELEKIQKMTSVMNKTIKVKNSKEEMVDWSAPFDWVKQVKDNTSKQ